MLINSTSFPGISFEHFDKKRVLNTTTVIRGRFRFHSTDSANVWQIRPDPDQGELLVEDSYYNDDLNDTVRFEADLAPFKPHTDIIFNGNSYSANRQPQKTWQCGIKVERDGKTLLNKKLQVTGPRQWEKVIKPLGWRLTPASPAIKVALNYSNAFGGTYEEDAPEKDEQDRWFKQYKPNPAGSGYFHSKEKTKQYSAPQVEFIEDPVTSTSGEHKPASFGSVLRHSSPRLEKAGTYDDKWLENEHPFYPRNFNEAHFQSAPDDQQIKEYLKGGEKITLAYLLPGEKIHQFDLPNYEVFCFFNPKEEDCPIAQMNLDTVLIDTESEQSRDWRVYLTWRIRIPTLSRIKEIETHILTVSYTHLTLPTKRIV